MWFWIWMKILADQQIWQKIAWIGGFTSLLTGRPHLITEGRPRPITCEYKLNPITACESKVYISYTKKRINIRNACKILYRTLQNLEICRIITTHNYLCFILNFKSHMLEKISIIAIIENTVSSCVQWDWRLYAHHSLVAKLPITIKNSRSAKRVYNIKKICQVRSVTEHWSLPLPAIGNWWDPEGSKLQYCLIYKAMSLLTKEGVTGTNSL